MSTFLSSSPLTQESVIPKLSKSERKRQYWHNHIHTQSNSSLTQREYCTRHALSYSNFTRWRGLYLKTVVETADANQPTSGDERSACAFVPVQHPTATSTLGANPASDSIIVVLRDGTRIEGVTEANLSIVTALMSSV